MDKWLLLVVGAGGVYGGVFCCVRFYATLLCFALTALHLPYFVGLLCLLVWACLVGLKRACFCTGPGSFGGWEGGGMKGGRNGKERGLFNVIGRLQLNIDNRKSKIENRRSILK